MIYNFVYRNFLGSNSIWHKPFFKNNPQYRQFLLDSILDALKTNSQSTYSNHFKQYIYWCWDRGIPPLQFPTSIEHFRAFLIDKIQEGKLTGTIRGYISACKWINDIAGVSNWNTKHFLFSRLRQVAKLRNDLSKANSSKVAIPLTRQHLKWLWNKYISTKGYSINIIGSALGFILSVLLGCRGGSIWAGKDPNKGIRFKNIQIIWYTSFINENLTKKYGLYPPRNLRIYIKGIRLKIYNTKSSTIHEYHNKFIGRTLDKRYDIIPHLLDYLIILRFKFNWKLSENDFLFRNSLNQPLKTPVVRDWIKRWKSIIPNIDTEKRNNIFIHSGRKTFCNLLYQAGWDMVKIAAYGEWSVPTAVACYYLPTQQEGLKIANLIFSAETGYLSRNYIFDMDKITFNRI